VEKTPSVIADLNPNSRLDTAEAVLRANLEPQECGHGTEAIAWRCGSTDIAPLAIEDRPAGDPDAAGAQWLAPETVVIAI
jgi:hypothetical protein